MMGAEENPTMWCDARRSEYLAVRRHCENAGSRALDILIRRGSGRTRETGAIRSQVGSGIRSGAGSACFFGK
jgi:hypothetical protein